MDGQTLVGENIIPNHHHVAVINMDEVEICNYLKIAKWNLKRWSKTQTNLNKTDKRPKRNMLP